ncbi:MAG: hypothetical protein JW871_07885 [Endomicrobiales bacterium]|nr:hypothetical protein [Endomicrobiales bacterium]
MKNIISKLIIISMIFASVSQAFVVSGGGFSAFSKAVEQQTAATCFSSFYKNCLKLATDFSAETFSSGKEQQTTEKSTGNNTNDAKNSKTPALANSSVTAAQGSFNTQYSKVKTNSGISAEGMLLGIYPRVNPGGGAGGLLCMLVFLMFITLHSCPLARSSIDSIFSFAGIHPRLPFGQPGVFYLVYETGTDTDPFLQATLTAGSVPSLQKNGCPFDMVRLRSPRVAQGRQSLFFYFSHKRG